MNEDFRCHAVATWVLNAPKMGHILHGPAAPALIHAAPAETSIVLT
jgi:hypothetical protein